MDKTNNISAGTVKLAKLVNVGQLRRLSELLADEEHPFSLRVRKCGKGHTAELTVGKADLGYYADMLEGL